MSDNFIFVNDVGPRDGLQNQVRSGRAGNPHYIDTKAYLMPACQVVEVASFVSPKAVPRMAGAGRDYDCAQR
jgi:hydroxymethylglutaryl-CoA lyase